ncbi:TonB-dependent receptor domain-containing protein [Sphingoaurantiacus capsulatus]|uniref:TonB-dependent receptor domain-containing protein n=1 Tax=Sphingoaurantiacus capsulatus TaxID=1771310 RepID=A0ABV7XF52_9SPHN
MRSLRLGCAIGALLVASTAVYAQETTGTIRGSVSDSAGNAVANATVTVKHTPSGTTSTSTTNNEGAFNAAGLRVGGPYEVTVASSGLETVTDTVPSISAGAPARLEVTLFSAAETITVTGSRQSSSIQLAAGPATVLDQEAIEGVASVNRDIRDLVRRDPFATIDPTNSRTVEIAGQNGRLNRFSVDGVQFSDDFGLNNGGLPTSRGPVPYDAIEQLTVQVAPYDVSEGDFQGGAINVVLRSGTNDFSGSAFYTYTDDSLTGNKSKYAVTATNPNGDINLKFDSKQYGGLLAGPIVKDKLFFMVGYEKLKESDPFDDGVGPGFANQVPGITEAQVAQVTQIAQTVYGYDTLGLIQNAVEEDEKIVGKLDWNVADDHRVSLTYIRNVGTQQFQQNTFLTPPQALGLQSNGYELAEEVNSGVLQLNSQWTDTFSTEVRASYRDYNRDQTPFGGRDFAQFEVCLDPTSVGAATSCGGSRLFFGPDVSRQSNDLNTETMSFDFTARKQAGDHTFKGTVGYTNVDVYNLFLQRSLGDVYFDSIAAFQARSAGRVRLGGAVPSLDPADAAALFSTSTYTFGLQDEWDILPELQVTYGARFDLYDSGDTPSANPNFLARNGFSNRETFKGRSAFQPRFGFNWQAADNIVIRGGAGIFAGGTPDVFLSNSFSNTGLLTNQVDINAANCVASGNTCGALTGVTGRSFPTSLTSFLTTNVASLATAPVNAVDPDLKVAKQFRATLSGKYAADWGGTFGDGWTFGVDLLYGEVINGYTYTDLRSVPIGTLPDGRTRYGPRGGVATTNQDLLLTNSSQGRSMIGVVSVDKEWSPSLNTGVSYTRSDIKDTNAITSSTAGSNYGNNAFLDPNFAAYGTSAYQIRDQYKFSVDYNHAFFGDYKTRFSLFGEYRSGRPYSVVGIDRSSGRSAVLGTVGNGGRGLLYVPTAGTDALVSFASAAQQTAFDNLVTQLGIEKFRGRIIPKNTQTAPDFFKVDLHFGQEIPAFVGKSRVELFADVENFLNILNSDWGSLRQVAFPQTAGIVDVQCLTAPVATGTTPTTAQIATLPTQACAQYRYSAVTAPIEGFQSRQSLYQIRVGAKFKF